MNFVKQYRCTLCDAIYKFEPTTLTCLSCGEKGILDIEYDYEMMKKVVNKSYFEKCEDYSIWRYKPMMSIHHGFINDTLHVGWTPLYHSLNLSETVNIKSLYIKDDSANPTASLKDRASVVAVVKALEHKQTIIACSSTGNAASSLAGHAAKVGLKSVIFVPSRAPIGKLTQLSLFGADVYKVDGDYKLAYALSKDAIKHFGWYNRNAAVNPHLVEGKKTVALEIAEQLEFNLTDWVVVSVGDGCTIAGVYKGFYDLYKLDMINKIPKLLGVQSEGCAPFYHAFKNDEPMKESEENTIADSIAVGIPRNPIKGMNAVVKSNGAFITVSDAEIIESMKVLASFEGIFSEPAAAASFAGLKNAINQNIIKSYETATIIITGSGLKDIQNAQKAMTSIPIIKANLTTFIETYSLGGKKDD
ncbi:threonine synthase [Liberiplasma polymorphum]|uniref:threonine synthase n=1 Tax=Liberiplasma polymorphum TaxID=3374570 RepID=UPI003774C58F